MIVEILNGKNPGDMPVRLQNVEDMHTYFNADMAARPGLERGGVERIADVTQKEGRLIEQ